MAVLYNRVLSLFQLCTLSQETSEREDESTLTRDRTEPPLFRQILVLKFILSFKLTGPLVLFLFSPVISLTWSVEISTCHP